MLEVGLDELILVIPVSLDKRLAGLEFIMQLCVEDDERAGTVLAVSNK